MLNCLLSIGMFFRGEPVRGPTSGAPIWRRRISPLPQCLRWAMLGCRAMPLDGCRCQPCFLTWKVWSLVIQQFITQILFDTAKNGQVLTFRFFDPRNSWQSISAWQQWCVTLMSPGVASVGFLLFHGFGFKPQLDKGKLKEEDPDVFNIIFNVQICFFSILGITASENEMSHSRPASAPSSAERNKWCRAPRPDVFSGGSVQTSYQNPKDKKKTPVLEAIYL